MQTFFDMAVEFNQKFDIPLNMVPGGINIELQEKGLQHLEEELAEIELGIAEGDHLQILDGLIDLCYVAMGMAAKYGFDFNEAFNRVHKSNLTKIRATNASDSKRGTTFDVIKGANFVPAELGDLV